MHTHSLGFWWMWCAYFSEAALGDWRLFHHVALLQDFVRCHSARCVRPNDIDRYTRDLEDKKHTIELSCKLYFDKATMLFFSGSLRRGFLFEMIAMQFPLSSTYVRSQKLATMQCTTPLHARVNTVRMRNRVAPRDSIFQERNYWCMGSGMEHCRFNNHRNTPKVAPLAQVGVYLRESAMRSWDARNDRFNKCGCGQHTWI